MLGWAGVVAIALWPDSALAQTPHLDPTSAAEHESIEHELHAAVGLYVTSAFLVSGGGSAILWGVTLFSTCYRSCDGATAGFVAGLIAAPLGVIALVIAIGLDIDALSRRGALRRLDLSIGPGPGELGLSLALRFEG